MRKDKVNENEIPKKKNGKLWVIILDIVLGLGVLVGFSFFFYFFSFSFRFHSE